MPLAQERVLMMQPLWEVVERFSGPEEGGWSVEIKSLPRLEKSAKLDDRKGKY